MPSIACCTIKTNSIETPSCRRVEIHAAATFIWSVRIIFVLLHREIEQEKAMCSIQDIYKAIAVEGFSESTLHMIDTLSNDIQNGHTNFPRYTIPEHAGLCTAGTTLIRASIVACYAATSLGAGSHAPAGQGGPSIVTNRQIDALQEQFIERWAKAARLWVEDSERILTEHFGPKIAQGAEAKVYYKEGDTSVVKERASIYSTTQKALDAIALHNYLFPETAMHVIGFTRDSDGLLRIILTQPYIRCLRLATKEEIDVLAASKGFRDNWRGEGVNYISERMALEDMHPANVFIDETNEKATCIDCIVKFI
ncbi:MAG: hypothetical protein IKP34_06510 [Bacteroidales bacterium]|nr:hypothetical protein [Bacteroidales bacterium]